MKKSKLAVDALEKSMEAYAAVESAVTIGGTSRQETLEAKHRAGTLSKSEQRELGQIWAGDVPEPIRKSLTETLEGDHADELDAAPFLKSLTDHVGSSLQSLEAAIVREGVTARSLMKAQGSLLRDLAGVVVGQQQLIKSMHRKMAAVDRRVETVERQPVVRKSHGADPRDVRERKPGRGTSGGQADTFSKSEVSRGFRLLAQHAESSGDDLVKARVAHAAALFETTGQVQPNVLEAIKQKLAE